jgi:serine/threonine-protein kinase
VKESGIAVGTLISHYQVTGKLGAGGMGEVYRARDSKLNREVAIKVLPEGFAQDAERIARFQREAQVLASLNHPNIAAIYGLEDADGIHALVMELVEGPTLADRIAAGPIPIDEALAIAAQIAEALEVAHERGIIHRDLKPANVKVTPDDKVKVLDFGLAKITSNDAPSDDLSHSPTMMQGTQAGMILGTAAYMSPEQAKGKVVDKRADIWAFGCVLFEMLAGKQSFNGETLTDTLAAVVRAEPDWDLLPATTPNAIRRLLHRCLTKDLKQRLRDIGEARIQIEEYLADPAKVASTSKSSPTRTFRRAR